MNVKDLRDELNKIIENDPALGYSEVVLTYVAYHPKFNPVYPIPVKFVTFKGLADKNVVILS
jgi:hypothetical protein